MTTATLQAEGRFLSTAGLIWAYMRPEILQIFRALSEIALLLPLAARFMPWAVLWPPAAMILWLLLLMLIPVYLDRVLALIGTRTNVRRVLLLGFGFIVVIINIRLLLYDPPSPFSLAWLGELATRLTENDNAFGRQDFTIIVLTILTWWRGLSLLGRRTDSKETGLRFRIMLLLVAPFVLILGAGRSATPYILLFLLSSLMVMALTRAQEVEAGESSAAFPITPGWLLRIFGASTAIALATGILTGLLTGRRLSTILGWLDPLWRAVQITATVVGAILFAAARPLFAFLDWFAALLAALGAWVFSNMVTVTPTPVEESIQGTPTPEPEQFMPVQNFGLDILSWLVDNARLLAAIGVALLLVLVVLYAYRSQRRLAVTREVQGIRGKTEKDQQPRARPGSGLLDGVRRWRRLWNAASIRRIYENLIYLAAVGGYPRDAVETPLEYLLKLDQAWPKHHADIVRITEAYMQIRYGEVPESKAELDVIREAWERVRQTKPVEPQPAEQVEATT